MTVRRINQTRHGKTSSVLIVDITVVLPDGSKKRIRKKCPLQTKRAAIEFERDLVARAHEEYLQSKGGITPILFSDLVTLFMERHAEIFNKPTTVVSKDKDFRNHLLPYLGDKEVSAIGKREISELTMILTRKRNQRTGRLLSNKTINNVLTTLHKTLDFAEEMGFLKSVPKVKWLKQKAPEMKRLTLEECERLAEAAEYPFRELITLAYRTGMRRGELRALHWRSIDFKAGIIKIEHALSFDTITTPKGGRCREIPISEDTVVMLKGIRHLRGPLVFCNDDGSPLTSTHMAKYLWKACDAAGIARIGWHTLRHTTASVLADMGVQTNVIMKVCGHTDIRTTLRYIHPDKDIVFDAVKMLDGESQGRHKAGAVISIFPTSQ